MDNQIINISEEIYSSDKFWNGIFRSICDSYKIEYVTNKGKKYMNFSNTWYDASKLREKFTNSGIKIAHKDYKCDGYWSDECDCKSKINKRKVNSDEIKYVFGGKFKFDQERWDEEYEDEDEDEDEDENEELKNNIKKILLDIEEKNTQYSISDIKFVFDKKIQINNEAVINKDHRGSDHMIIKLPFEKKVILNNQFTLEDLIVANTNVKSHKFDYWYELFCRTKCVVNNDIININLIIDHGS